MMICKNCRTQYADGKKFCQKCGSQLAPEESMSPEIMAQRQILETRLAQDPANGSLLAEYADLLAKIGLSQEASSRLRSFLEAHPADTSARRALARALETAKAWDESAAQLLVLLADQPGDIDLQASLARCYLAADRRSSALEVLSRLASASDAGVDILIQLRDLLLNEARYEALPALCRRILEQVPDDRASWRALADALLRAGDREGAQVAFANLLQLAPGDARACYYVGSHRFEQTQGDAGRMTREVLPLLETALGDPMRLSDEELDRAKIYQACAQLLTGSVDPALLTEIERLSRTRDHWTPQLTSLMVGALEMVARLWREAGDVEAAMRVLRQALEIDDSTQLREKIAALITERGDLEAARGRLEEAQQEYARALETCPGNPRTLERLQALNSRQRTRRRLRYAFGASILIILLIAAGELYFGVRALTITVDRPATISVSSWARQISTDTQARTLTLRLPPGPYHIHIESSGYPALDADGRVGVNPGTDQLDFKLAPQADEASSGSALAIPAASGAQTSRRIDDSVLSSEDVRNLLEQWRQAQDSQDTRAYASCYSQDFHGIKRVKTGFTVRYDLNGWLTDRRKMIIGATWLAVEIQGLRISPGLAGSEATASFTQTYRSNSYSDRGEKLMSFRKSGGLTKITYEEMKWSVPL